MEIASFTMVALGEAALVGPETAREPLKDNPILKIE